MIYIIKNRNFDKHFHHWRTNKDTPYVYNLNSSRKAALNARGGERGGRNLRLCPERLSFKSWGHFTWRRLTFTVKSRPYPVAYHLPQWHLGDLRFCRPQNLFSCRPCCSCFGPLGRESANPTSSTAYPTSSTYRSLLYSLAWLSRLARFNRPCRVFNGYISRHFEMPDTGAQDILLADILSR